MTSNQLRLREIEEREWYDRAYVGEMTRHNVVTESNEVYRNQETHRHNLVTEDLSDRSLQESVRHNKATEDIGYAQVGATYANIALGYARMNAEMALGYDQLAESSRHNMANEHVSRYSAENVAAFNRTRAQQAWQSLDLDAKRYNLAVDQFGEAARHNQALESISRSANTRDWIYGGVDAFTKVSREGRGWSDELRGWSRDARDWSADAREWSYFDFNTTRKGRK